MRKVSQKDKEKVISILSSAFIENPSVLWVIKQDNKITSRLKSLINYAFSTGLNNDGVFLSNDETAAAICFKEPSNTTISSYWNQLLLIKNGIGIERVPLVLKRESYLKANRPKEPHLNFWFLGASPTKENGSGTRDLRDGIFSISNKKKLPILLETSVEKNKRVYEYFGFELYHKWAPTSDYTLYFMRRPPSSI